MDGERVGPLSYSVDAPEGETSAQRAIIAATLVVTAAMVVSIVGGWFALGFVPSGNLVVDGLPLAMIVGALGTALWFSRGALRQAKRTALVTMTVVSLFAAFLTQHVLAGVKPAIPQVRHSIDVLHMPAGFTLRSEETSGDRFCRRGCPTVDRFYNAPEADPDPVSTLILAMFRQGWHTTSDVDPKSATVAAKGLLTAQLQEIEPHVVEITVSRS
jgi:hypothetical protein